MSKYKCTTCGAPTDNDQSFTVPAHITGAEPKRYEVHRCDKCDRRFNQELDWESEGETFQEDKITCPYCGYECDDYDGYSFEEGKTEEVECPVCDRKFDLEVEVKRTYSTKRSLCEMPENYGEEQSDGDHS